VRLHMFVLTAIKRH